MIILDTSIWIKYIAKNLSKKNLKLKNPIDKAILNSNLAITDMTLWEVSMLAAKKRINLQEPIEKWLMKSIRAINLRIISINPQIAALSSNLPGKFINPDPADRIIMATTIANNATLITEDRKIINYAKQGHINILY